jgi:hypothetical protein
VQALVGSSFGWGVRWGTTSTIASSNSRLIGHLVVTAGETLARLM